MKEAYVLHGLLVGALHGITSVYAWTNSTHDSASFAVVLINSQETSKRPDHCPSSSLMQVSKRKKKKAKCQALITLMPLVPRPKI